jgi:N utilization substance protein A
VAVSATQPGVDPVGACVGIKGVRIQAIVKELHDEKIDIIQWDPDPVVYISKAISPARVIGVYLSDIEGSRTATVVVGEDQLSLAIGRDGQNARLAAKLTGWRIDIKSLVEAAGDAIVKMQTDEELAALLPKVAESIPTVEEILAKKAENRPVTPEEYTVLGQFVDRVEKRTIQIMEEEAREEEEKIASVRAEIPEPAFEMPLEQAGIKEHIYNILTEANIETVGDMMMKMKLDQDSILGMSGIGPKAIENIDESLAAIKFPEPPPAEPEVAPAPEAASEAESQPEVVLADTSVELMSDSIEASEEPAAVSEEMPIDEKQVQAKKAARKHVKKEEEPEDEGHKDGVSLDELFSMKPEIFQNTSTMDEEEPKDKKKSKKGNKKKSVALEYDEELGEVVARKKHKRGDDGFDEDEW